MKLSPMKCLSLVFFSFLIIPTFANTPQEAKDVLAQKKIAYNEDEFFTLAREGKTDQVKLFLEAGMNVNAKDTTGGTALMSAAFWGHMGTVQVLIVNGADVNAKDNMDRTALMAAVFNGASNIVKYLLDNGAEVNAKNKGGYSALSFAIKSDRRSIIKLLKDAGAKD